VALTSGDGRYRAGVEVPLVILAAVGIDAMAGRRRRRLELMVPPGTGSSEVEG